MAAAFTDPAPDTSPEGVELDLRQRGVAARRSRAWLARTDVNTFIEFVMKDEATGAPLRQGPAHVGWHRLMDRHKRVICWSAVEQGKTIGVAVGRTLWKLGRNPSLRCAIVSNTHGQAVKVVRMIKRYIETSAELREVFPALERSEPWTDSGVTVKRDFIAKEPSVQALGIHGSVIGSRIDYCVLDDVLDYENTRNEEQRQNLWDWYHSTLVGRFTADSDVVVIGNAYHPRDLLHRLAAHPSWMARRFPARRENGESSWPEAWPEERLVAKAQELGPLETARQLYCKAFNPNEARFKPEWLDKAKARGAGTTMVRSITSIPPGCAAFTGVDTAVQQHERADLTAFATILVHPNEDRELLCLESGRWTGPEIVERVIDTHERYHSIVMVENVGALDYILQFIRERSAAPVFPFTTGRNKANPDFGLESLATEFYNEKWIIPSGADGKAHPEIDALLSEMLFYAPGAHTGDRLMALWFSREAARRFGLQRRRPAGRRSVGALARK